jgi:hypothetical protein
MSQFRLLRFTRSEIIAARTAPLPYDRRMIAGPRGP